MQARLSTDILNKAGLSKFIRTERGRFTLRSKVLTVEQTREGSQGDSPVTQSEYVAERRVLRTPREEVFALPKMPSKMFLPFRVLIPTPPKFCGNYWTKEASHMFRAPRQRYVGYKLLRIIPMTA
jgi:hypothetical protein